jgi:hypothetical protein
MTNQRKVTFKCVIRNGDQYFLAYTVTVDGEPDPEHTIISERDLNAIIEGYKAEYIHNDLTFEELSSEGLTKSWIAKLSVTFDANNRPLEIEGYTDERDAQRCQDG